ncbi:hypothetical protein VNO77_41051 [Canavalia gladiata]|uniref:Uncharacterized protein n=1 Tax=Canavalia gladiata TaxID=3824 RepID=A0AAN9PRE9_CANGL
MLLASKQSLDFVLLSPLPANQCYWRVRLGPGPFVPESVAQRGARPHLVCVFHWHGGCGSIFLLVPTSGCGKMKVSVKFQGEDENQHSTQIMTAKVPISILNSPFVSGITASTSTESASEFCFSLSTNFSSGPSLRVSYSPTSSSLPFSLSLKSGLGLLGSPRHSPLVFSANFSLSPTHPPLPSFFLHFKPQFGHFSLNKTVFSEPLSLPPPTSVDNSEIGNVFLPDVSSSGWQDLKLEPSGGRDQFDPNCMHTCGDVVKKNDSRYGLSPAVGVMARTVIPVTKRFFFNFRWGVNFPGKFGSKMPYLTVNKIGLEKVEEVKENNKQRRDTSDTDLQLLKGMCFWMRRDLELVEKENREMKHALDEMKMGVSGSTSRNYYPEGTNGVGKKLSQSSGEFQRLRSNKSERQEDEKKQPNKSQSIASDVESELQKAIKAATS